MLKSPIEYVSVGSAGLGLFAYLGLFSTLARVAPVVLADVRGFVGVSAGAFASLFVALGLHADKSASDSMYRFAKTCTLLSNHKVCNFGIFARQVGKNMLCDLEELARFMLRLGGRRDDTTLGQLQASLQVHLTFVATDLISMQPVRFDAARFPDMPVAEAISLSAAVPFLTAPVQFGDRLITDGAVTEHINMCIYDPTKTLFVLCDMVSPAEPLPEERQLGLDLVSVANRTMACLAKQHENLTRTVLYDLRCLRVSCKSMFRYMDSPSYELDAELDYLYAQGCARALGAAVPGLCSLIGALCARLARHACD